MKRIILPPQRPDVVLPFFLAVEEWVAKNLPDDEYFFAWQVNPTVICGRHQVIPLEVDLDFAERKGIYICRRKSGGGSVYADRSNVMFSYITPSDSVQTTFGRYTAMICRMLDSLGIKAEPTGRNDIAVSGKKVAGNAFWKLPDRSIVHGTMLYDADFDTMSQVLTPSRAKRMSKGVVSVPSRVTTLRNEGLAVNCGYFIEYAVNYLCRDGEYALTDSDLKAIDEILATYLDPHFLNFAETVNRGKADVPEPIYIEGLGEMAIDFSVDGDNRISSVSLRGDFFPLQDVCKLLNDTLAGVPYSRSEIEKALNDINPGAVVAGLTHEKFKILLPNT